MSFRKMGGRETGSPERSGFFAAAAPLVLSMVLFWPFGGGHNTPLTSTTIDPSAEGTVALHNTNNRNTAVDLTVKYLAQPNSLTPSENVYVVWIQPNGHQPINEGQLTVNGYENGQLKTETPYKQFRIFVTAEKYAQEKAPSGPQVLSASVTQG